MNEGIPGARSTIIIYIVLGAGIIWLQWDSDRKWLSLGRVGLMALLAFLVVTTINGLKNGHFRNVSHQLNFAFFVIVGIGGVGLYNAGALIVSKDESTIAVKRDGGAPDLILRGKMLLLLSHHTVILTGDFVQVVPTQDIRRIVSRSADAPKSEQSFMIE